MSSSDRRTSLSPSERQRTKSQSSYRSHRTTPSLTGNEQDAQRARTPSQTSRPSTRETNAKRSESSASNRAATAASPGSPSLKRQKSGLKSTTPTPTGRRPMSRGKKRPISVSDIERRKLLEPNDSIKQDLAAQGLSVVPPDIFDLVTLRRLILSHNNLSGLPQSVGSLVNLEYLDISHNPLIVVNGHDDFSCFPREFRHLKCLRTLVITDCSLKHIPVAVWDVIGLQTLDLSRNKIGYIVGDIGNLVDIRHLRLCQMDLDTLPAEIGFCNKVETIDLIGNPIDNLPETLVECRQLHELRINYKTFGRLLDNYMLQLIDQGKIRSEHIPQVIFELENLRVLDLTNANINYISNEHSLLHLSELYVSNNSFNDIPESICTIAKLKLLDMSNNHIQTLPEHLTRIKTVETLNLSHNTLTTLSKIYAQLPNLKRLILNHNAICMAEKNFSKAQSLLSLDISYNSLREIPDELCELERLETLDFRYNRLQNLSSNILRMTGLKSMNTFGGLFQRTGLHLSGNSITNPPGYIWKSTNIQTLFDYVDNKQKSHINTYFHLKCIFIGPKNVGKTTLVTKLLKNRHLISNTRKTIDAYIFSLQQKQMNTDETNIGEQQASKDVSSSTTIDQWIENRISTSDDHAYSRHSKTKRIHPPPIKTYRSDETIRPIINKSSLITKDNFHFTLFDLASEPSFEILYPLIYDSKALYILPINLTILFNEMPSSNETPTLLNNFDSLLTSDWLHTNIFRYFKSLCDHCQHVSIVIIGLVDDTQTNVNNEQAQQFLDEIRLKVNEFISDTKAMKFYAGYFPELIRIHDEHISSSIIEQLEAIAYELNIAHHKHKRRYLKRRFKFLRYTNQMISYDICLREFRQRKPSSSSDDDNDKNLVENEINSMSFDECLDYLKLIGDIFCFGEKARMKILTKPYDLLNKILSKTIFRPQMDQWLNYDDNLIFRFSGYYPTQKLFDIDRDRILNRGEFSWGMLNVLFLEQNNTDKSLNEKNLIDYCHLMERLYLGYLNQANQNFRRYEHLRCERARYIKQQKLWFSIDNRDNFPNDNTSLINSLDVAQNYSDRNAQVTLPDLPSIDQIEIIDTEVINQDSIETMKIFASNPSILPDGLYERLLICLQPLFSERMDYLNFTFGRTSDKNLIKIERLEKQNQINLTMNHCLSERIRNILVNNLFLLYPKKNLQIET